MALLSCEEAELEDRVEDRVEEDFKLTERSTSSARVPRGLVSSQLANIGSVVESWLCLSDSEVSPTAISLLLLSDDGRGGPDKEGDPDAGELEFEACEALDIRLVRM